MKARDRAPEFATSRLGTGRALFLWLILLVAALVPAHPAGALAGSAGELGTIDTVAGPGFCQGASEVDPESTSVRALAVAPSGHVFVDTGPLSGGSVAEVFEDVSIAVHEARSSVQMDPGPSAGWQRGSAQAASRLVHDGNRRALVAAGDRVVYLIGGSSLAGKADRGKAGSTGDGGPAENATFTSVLSITTDPAGNLFVADAVDLDLETFRVRYVNRGSVSVTIYGGTARERIVERGSIVTVAGSESSDGLVDGVGADSVRLMGGPPAMAATGDLLFIAASGPEPDGRMRSTVQVLNLGSIARMTNGLAVGPGEMATIAGGTVGFAGDGGSALTARFGYVPGISASATGDVFLADRENHRVRRIDSQGMISTFAGSGTPGPGGGGYDGNGRPATQSLLNRPFDVKVGPAGRVYISDGANGQVRYVEPDGIMHGLPMRLTPVSTCQDETPSPAALSSISTDSTGTIYLTGQTLSQVKRVGGTGSVTNLAGKPQRNSRGSCPPWPPGCPTGDLLAATDTPLDQPTSLASGLGGVYVYEAGHRAVRFVNTSERTVAVQGVSVKPGVMRVVAAGQANPVASEVPGPDGELSEQVQLAADRNGNLFLADAERGAVWAVDRQGETVQVLPTLGAEGTQCCERPVAVAATESGNLYVLDSKTNRVWFLNRSGAGEVALGQEVPAGQAAPVVGDGGVGVSGEGLAALATQLLRPVAIAVGREGDLFLADEEDNTVSRVDRLGTIRAVAGSGREGAFSGDGQRGTLTRLDRPRAIAVDTCGRLLIAEAGSDRVRRLNLAPQCIPTDETRGFSPPGAWPSRRIALAITGLAGGAMLIVWMKIRRLRRKASQSSDR